MQFHCKEGRRVWFDQATMQALNAHGDSYLVIFGPYFCRYLRKAAHVATMKFNWINSGI